MEPVVVRLARYEDFDGYLSLLRDLPGSNTAIEPSINEFVAWLQLISAPESRCYVLDYNRVIVATATALLCFAEDTQSWEPTAQLHNFVVDNRQRGCGIGSILLNSIKKDLGTLGVSEVKLQTQQPKAVDFYLKHEFSSVEAGGFVLKITPSAHTAPCSDSI